MRGIPTGRCWHAACCHRRAQQAAHWFWAEMSDLYHICIPTVLWLVWAHVAPSCCPGFMALGVPCVPRALFGYRHPDCHFWLCLKRRGWGESTLPHLPNHDGKLCANGFFNII